MCTIHTYSTKCYNIYKSEIISQIRQDAVTNDDGISMVFLDGHNDRSNTIYRTMDAENLIAVLDMLMSEATKHARLFIHLRAATTLSVGVGYTHAFDDMNGTVYMHNGVISNPKGYSVDSFQMASWKNTEGAGLLNQLISRKETFANVFRIDMDKYKWSVTRMDGAFLYTDNEGNYSSRSFGPLTTVVPQRSTKSFSLDYIEKPRYENYYTPRIPASWSSSSTSASVTGSSGSSGSASTFRKYKHGDKWDSETQDWISGVEWERKQSKGSRTTRTAYMGPTTPVLPAVITRQAVDGTILGPVLPVPKGDDRSLPAAVDTAISNPSVLLDESVNTPEHVDSEYEEQLYDEVRYAEWLEYNTRTQAEKKGA